jgi:biotin transport system substrate-specific component
MICGGLIQGALPWFGSAGFETLTLPSLQVPALLFTALVCGPRAAMLSGVAYISIGLFQLPVFQGGGGLNYLLDPGFGYIAGFLPAAWLTGRLARQPEDATAGEAQQIVHPGLLVLQGCGLANLLLGGLVRRWGGELPQLVLSYSLLPLVPQLVLCCGVAVLALPARRILMVER